MTRNSIISANTGASFGSKTISNAAYVDNLGTVLRAQESVEKYFDYGASPPQEYTMSLPGYVKNPVSISFDLLPPIAGRWTVQHWSVTVYVNGTRVAYSDTDELILPLTLTGSDTVRFVYEYSRISSGGSSFYGRSGFCKYTIPTLTLAQYVSSTGLWLEYSDGSMEKFASGQYYTDRMQMTAPVNFDSNSYLALNNCANFLNYWTFTDEDSVSHTLNSGTTYAITSTNLYVLDNLVTGTFFTRNASSVVLIYEYNGSKYSIEMVSGGYYQVYGTIKIAQTDTVGVKMKGCYPKTTGTYDCGNSEYKWNNVYSNYINGSVYPPSSIKMKTNVAEYTGNALELLKQVLVSTFNYKFEVGTEKCFTHYGFIAENTPEELATPNHDTMDVGSCIGVLIKAVQELSAEIERLKGGNA